MTGKAQSNAEKAIAKNLKLFDKSYIPLV